MPNHCLCRRPVRCLAVLPALLASVLIFFAGCGETQSSQTPSGPAPNAGGVPPAGAAVAAAPQRIVAFAPSLAEFVFKLGAQQRLVGVSQYCVEPPGVKQIPVLGNAIDPDLEKILAARPDLILTVGEGTKLHELGQAHQIPVQALKIETLEQVLAAPMIIGRLIGADEKAKRLSAQLKGDIDAVATVCQKRTATPRVLVFTGEGGGGEYFTIGQGSFLTDLVTLCGGESVTGHLAKPWPKINLEDLAQSNPDVILLLRAVDEMPAAERQKLIDHWQAYPYFPAVKNNRVVVVTGNFLLLGGPRITLTALALARAIHPELWPQAPTAPVAPQAPTMAPTDVPSDTPNNAPPPPAAAGQDE